MSNSLYYEPNKDIDPYFMPQCQSYTPQLLYTNPSFNTYFPSKVLESSDTSSSNHSIGSKSIQTFSSDISSCVTDELCDLKYKLRELETAMLGPDSDVLDNCNAAFDSGNHAVFSEIDTLGKVMKMIATRDVKQALVACARAIAEDDMLVAQWLMDELRQMVSVSGDPIQRLGAYMLEGLVAKQSSSGSSIYRALRFKDTASSDLSTYVHILFEVCPYIKFGYMSANGAIALAMKHEKRVHIVDFHIGQGSQWVTLIQAFASRPGGPPRIRITGIDDSYSACARGGGLGLVGKRLSKLAKLFKVPFSFHGVETSGYQIQLRDLGVQQGEALAVNFALILHHMPDESVTTENQRDRVLRLVKGLNPKVVTLVEQECNTNSAAFLPRFLETMEYYTAMFESMDVTLPRDHKDRINIEQHCFARDVVNLVACEGAERVERHELLAKWRSRFTMAGFRAYPLSSLVNSTIRALLKGYSDKYRVDERDGGLYLGWMNRDLVTCSAWQCN